MSRARSFDAVPSDGLEHGRVCGGHPEPCALVRVDPPERREKSGAGSRLLRDAQERMELDSPVRIGVTDRTEPGDGSHPETRLLPNLPHRRPHRVLPGVDFAARELPDLAHARITLPAPDQYPAGLRDNPYRDLDRIRRPVHVLRPVR
jgi:hypothetical protein